MRYASCDARTLRDVRRLGHLPKNFDNPQVEEDKAENRLADRIQKSCDKVLTATLTILKDILLNDQVRKVRRLDQPPPLDAGILEDVRRLGHLPKLFNGPRSEEDKAEHRLADRNRKS